MKKFQRSAVQYCKYTPLNYTLKNGYEGFTRSSAGKKSTCNAGNPGSIPQEDPLEKGMATHLSILTWRIPMDRGARWAIVRSQGYSQD